MCSSLFPCGKFKIVSRKSDMPIRMLAIGDEYRILVNKDIEFSIIVIGDNEIEIKGVEVKYVAEDTGIFEQRRCEEVEGDQGEDG